MEPSAAVVIAVAWPLVGLLSGLWMARRGYDPLWILIALPLGPLFVPIAAERVRRRPGVATTGALGTPATESAAGPRVLIGWDGSADSRHALNTAQRILGTHCGLLVLAEVVGFEAVEKTGTEDVDAAAARLADAAAAVRGVVPVHTAVLTGPPGPALRDYAGQNQIDLLVVGRRGHGLSARVLGSVSADLIEHSTVPVLVVEPGEPGD